MNKALAEYKGRKLIDYPVRLLERYCSHILISSNQPLPLPYPVVPDVFSNLGPMAGLYSCLIRSASPYNIVLSCDMPLLSEELINLLISKAETGKIVVPVHGNQLMEPLCAIYPDLSGETLLESIRNGQLTLHEYILHQPHIKADISHDLPFPADHLFMNINTLTDLENIKNF